MDQLDFEERRAGWTFHRRRRSDAPRVAKAVLISAIPPLLADVFPSRSSSSP